MTVTAGRMALVCVLAALALAGCCNLLPKPPAPTPGACIDTACFLVAAVDCQDMNVTLKGSVATFAYSSSQSCVLTKTLVSVDTNDTQAMKDFLQGKSMACPYQKGRFDPGLVTSMVDGMENCTGDLKDALSEMLIFT